MPDVCVRIAFFVVITIVENRAGKNLLSALYVGARLKLTTCAR
jgi:hypothetical protein